MVKRKISCLPCRVKKVKCDGEKPCNRCEMRQTTCIYQKPGAVGRPPKNAVVNKLVLSRMGQQSTSNNPKTSFCREFIFENISLTPVLATVRYIDDNKQYGLDHYINTIFSTYFSNSTSLDRFIHEKRNEQVIKYTDYTTATPKVKIFDLTHYFTWMSADIANILVRRVSKLKLSYYTDLEFSTTALAYDCTTTFFETPAEDSLVINPLNSLPPQQAIRLIECFFCIHPHSILLNKTMLLQSYWTDTTDPLLLSVVYGTTIFKSQLLDGKPLELWDALNKKKRNPFLDYAHVILSKATAEATPSRYQAVVLLALFEVTFGFPKRGMALFGLSYMLAARLGLFDNSMPPGLDPVERELLLVTFWSAFECTIRGCVELEQIPRAALTHHEHPYPPPNIKLSRSYQYDIESNNPRLFKSYYYLVETFYIQAVVSKFSCKIILQLPHSSRTTCNSTSDMERLYKTKCYKPVSKASSMIKTGIQQVLEEFKAFNETHKKDWSKLQVYTLELFCSFFSICLYFLRDSISNPDERKHPFSLHKRHLPGKLDLTDVDNVLHVHETVPEAIGLIEKSFAYLSDPENYYQQSDFLPRGIIISAVDAASQVLMYSYQLEQTEQVRYYLEMAALVLSMPAVWGDWGTAELVKGIIDDFLKAHPQFDSATANSNDDFVSTSSCSSFHEFNSSSSSISTDFMTSFLQSQQAAAQPVVNDFINHPWLTGEEPWIQDINSIIYSSSLFPMPFTETQQQQQQQQQQQAETNQQELYNILSGLF